MEDNNRNRELLNILNGLSEKDGIDLSHTEEKKTGLVFLDSDTETSESEVRVAFETVDTEEDKPKEFFVPEKFEINEKYDTPVKQENAPRVMTTYVPRFTEASENYRILGEPHKTYVKSERESDIATAEIYEQIDPTAEIDKNNNTEVQEVQSGVYKADDEFESASKVFKFAGNDEEQKKTETLVNKTEELTTEFEETVSEVTEFKESGGAVRALTGFDYEQAVSAKTAVSTALYNESYVEDTPLDIGDAFDGKAGNSEYSAYSERDSFKDRFLDLIMSVKVRFWVSLALSLLLLAVESVYAFGVDIPRLMGLATVPGAMALIDIEIVVCLYLLSLPENLSAIKSLLRGKLTSGIFTSASLAVLIAYTVFITAISPKEYMLFGFVFAVTVLSAIGATYFKTSADFTAFKAVSTNGEKRIIDSRATRTLASENSALDGLIEEHKSKTARVFRTLFVSGFFGRTSRAEDSKVNTAVIASVSFGLSLLSAAVAFFILDGWVSAVSAFAFVFVMGAPAFSLLSHKIPYFYAACEAEGEKSAVIGESSIYASSGVDVITFNDTEVFGKDDVTLQRIMLFGNSENLTKALRQMSSLFANVGGPLDYLFSNSLDKKCAPSETICIEEDGICGEISGNTVFAGTLEYMKKNGVGLPEGEENINEKVSDTTKIMYAGENGQVYAKFYIRYSFSEEFSMLLPLFEDYGIKPLIYTRDPNITEKFITSLTAGVDKMRILKKRDLYKATDPIYKNISAGMVTYGDKNNAINMIILTKRYTALSKKIMKAELISMGTGIVLALILSLLGLNVPSILLGLWHVLWCAGLFAISSKKFSKQKTEKGN